MNPFFCLLLLLLGFNFSLNAQNNYDFIHASETEDKTYLFDQIEQEYEASLVSLEQEELTSKQRSALKKQLLERYNAGKSLIKSKKVIISGELYSYVNDVFNHILVSNPEVNQNSKLVLFRDVNFNAFTLGDNIVFCNVGLLYRLKNKEELALILAHELAHNSSKHSFQKMVSAVKLQTDDELNKQINKIIKSDYGQVTALNALLIPTLLETKEKSREHEYEADSLGLVYYLQSGYSSQKATNVFEIMKGADSAFNSQPIDYFQLFEFSNQSTVSNRYKGYRRGSSLGSFEADTNQYESFLRTHPLEENRIHALERQIGINNKDGDIIPDTVYMKHLYMVHGEMIYSSLSDQNFSDAMYYAIRMQQKYNSDNYSKSAMSFMYSMLSYYKTRRMSGRFISNQDAKNDEVYDRNNYFLSILTPAECLELSKTIRNNWLKSDFKGIFTDLADMTYEYHNKNLESLSLRIELIEPQVESTSLEPVIKTIKEDPAVRGKI